MANSSQPKDPDSMLNLAAFFPYRLSVLYDEVSQCVAQVYTERFDLTRHQWRVLATIGGNAQLSARQVGEKTRMDKMPVSRAVSQLESKGLVRRKVDASDKRYHQLTLTAVGRKTYRKIVPLVKAREAFVLSALELDEIDFLNQVMDKILSRSRELKSYG